MTLRYFGGEEGSMGRQLRETREWVKMYLRLTVQTQGTQALMSVAQLYCVAFHAIVELLIILNPQGRKGGRDYSLSLDTGRLTRC